MSLFAVMSDIHANYAALQAVVQDAHAQAKKMGEELSFVGLGDVVDLGPQPNECMQWFVENSEKIAAVVLGNHDFESVQHGAFTHDLIWHPISYWTRQELKSQYKEVLKNWKKKLHPSSDGLESFTLVHASPSNPLYTGLKHTTHNFDTEFEHFDTSYGFVGHTHLPGYLIRHTFPRRYEFFYALKPNIPKDDDSPVKHDRGWKSVGIERWIELTDDKRALINPGSVGQPRPFDIGMGLPGPTCASYVLLHVSNDTIRFQFRRAKYRSSETTIALLQQIEWTSEKANLRILEDLQERFRKRDTILGSVLQQEKTLNKMMAVLNDAKILKTNLPLSIDPIDEHLFHSTKKLNDITSILIEDLLIPLLRYGTLDHKGNESSS